MRSSADGGRGRGRGGGRGRVGVGVGGRGRCGCDADAGPVWRDAMRCSAKRRGATRRDAMRRGAAGGRGAGCGGGGAAFGHGAVRRGVAGRGAGRDGVRGGFDTAGGRHAAWVRDGERLTRKTGARAWAFASCGCRRCTQPARTGYSSCLCHSRRRQETPARPTLADHTPRRPAWAHSGGASQHAATHEHCPARRRAPSPPPATQAEHRDASSPRCLERVNTRSRTPVPEPGRADKRGPLGARCLGRAGAPLGARVPRV